MLSHCVLLRAHSQNALQNHPQNLLMIPHHQLSLVLQLLRLIDDDCWHLPVTYHEHVHHLLQIMHVPLPKINITVIIGTVIYNVLILFY